MTGEEAAVGDVTNGKRAATARGTIINSAFFFGLGSLNVLKTVVVAGYMTAAEFGIWSILLVAVSFVGALKAVAVSDKYIQQSEADQQRAFQRAFTLEVASALALTVAMLGIALLLPVVFGEDKLLAPGLALALMLPALAFQSPIWIFYRRMDFYRQRLLMSVDPIVGLVVTLVLAVEGFGYWALVAGVLAGAWAGGVVAVIASPYRLRFDFDRATFHEYVHFSWPLVAAAGGGLAIAQFSVFFGDLAVGLAGVGAIGLASTFSGYTDRVDGLVTAAMYPAVCRVKDRPEVMFEAFLKSNRLTLMWGIPFGVGLTLFASDLVEFGLGSQWTDAVVMLEVFGLAAAVNHIGFNWTAFYRARGETKPVAVVAWLSIVAFVAIVIPLLFAAGLDGFAAGVALMTAVALAARFYYVRKLFPQFRLLRYSVRSLAPVAPGALLVIAFRATGPDDRVLVTALAELVAFVLVTGITTWLIERDLLREALSYLTSKTRSGDAAGAATP